jgi:hypothetical protein
MRDIHLSIDLDYWTDHLDPYWEEDSNAVWGKLVKYNIPTTVIRYHHHAVRHISKACNELINVDEHSDYPMALSGFHCGSWASPEFLPFIRKYTWYCNGEGSDCSVYNAAHTLKFRKYRRRNVGWVAKSFEWDFIHSCTICLSPDYANKWEVYKSLRKTVTTMFGKVKR